MKTVFADELRLLVGRIFTSRGVSERDSTILADCLVHADLTGLSTHGVFRIAHYINRLEAGSINPAPTMAVTRTGPATATLDGDDGYGHVALWDAMGTALDLARESGIGFVGVNRSNHCGALSFFTQRAIDEGFIGLALTQTDKGVVPFGGCEPFCGTNPLSVGVPTQEGPPIILDMATSTVAGGHIYKARTANRPIPNTWALDHNGQPTTDPHQAAYWTPAAGAKGYGLGVIIDILTGILSGGAFGPHIPPMYSQLDVKRNLCHLAAAIDFRRFAGAETFLQQVGLMGKELRSARSAEGFEAVMTPGEPEFLTKQQRLNNGIPIDDELWVELNNLATK